MLAPPAPTVAAPKSYAGVVTSRRSQVITAEFQAPLVKMFAYNGQRVRAGDPIATLDERSLRAQLEGARAQEKAARSDAGAAGAQASALARRMKVEQRLVRSGVSSKQALYTAQADRSSAGAQAAAASNRAAAQRASVVELENMLANATPKAPIDGVAMSVKLKEGQQAEKGMPIARIYDTSDLLFRFAVPKGAERNRLARGTKVELQIEGVKGTVRATIEKIIDEEPPLGFAVVEADIDDTTRPPELEITSQGRAQIAVASAGATR